MTIRGDQATPSVSTHVVVGFLIGLGVGILIMHDAKLPGPRVSAFIVCSSVAGALVGLELAFTHAWLRFGRLGNLARWLLATVSSSFTVVPLMIHFQLLDREVFGLAVLSSLGIGLAIWAADERQRDRNASRSLRRD